MKFNVNDYPWLRRACLAVAYENRFLEIERREGVEYGETIEPTVESFLLAVSNSVNYYLTDAFGDGHIMDREFGEPNEGDFLDFELWVKRLSDEERRNFVGNKVDGHWMCNEELAAKCPYKRVYWLMTYALSEGEMALSGEE